MQKSVEVTELASSLSLKSLVLYLNQNPLKKNLKKKKNPLLSSKQKKNIPYLLNCIYFLPIKSRWQKYPRDEKHSLNPGTFRKHRSYVKLTAIMAAEMQTPIRK